MQTHPVLGHVALGYSPMIDRQRAVVATRLTVFPERPGAEPDAAALLQALAEVWPDAAGAGAAAPLRPPDPAALHQGARAQPPVSLNVADETLLRAVMAQPLGLQWMVEVPAFMMTEPADILALQRLRAAGIRLAIKGRPLAPLATEVLSCFSHAIVEAGEDRRVAARPAAGARQVSTLQSGVRTTAEMATAFDGGAVGVLGWPFDDPLPTSSGRSQPANDVQVVLELIQGVEREEPVPRLESVLKRDPALAFRLMRFLNSPAFGLTVEINSFSQALMLLGYQRLKRWLALLLASSSRVANAKPTVFAAGRRGLLMAELARNRGDATMRGEMFICGVFSLLDRLLAQPLPDLLQNVQVPDTVQQALRGDGGPYLPYLQLVQAIEQESAFDMREYAERLLLSTNEVNRALLTALQAAQQLEG